MAKCDQGYLCQVCGKPVERIIESSLYLQYVIGWVDPEKLHLSPDQHLACNPTLSQFIEDERFQTRDGSKKESYFGQLDPEFVLQRTQLISRGYRRLWELLKLKNRPAVRDYPLDDVGDNWR